MELENTNDGDLVYRTAKTAARNPKRNPKQNPKQNRLKKNPHIRSTPFRCSSMLISRSRGKTAPSET